MPNAIVSVFYKIAYTVFYKTTVSFAAAKAIAAVATTAIVAAGNYGLQKLAESLIPKPKIGNISTDVEYSDTVAPRRIIFGTMRVSGMNVIPPLTSGPKNEYLHQVLALAGHEVNDITDVYFGQDTIASANISAITSTINDGTVTAGAYANKAWIRRYKGTATQASDYILDATFGEWETTAQGKGVAYIALRYAYDTEVYRNGKPDVTCLVQGLKVYDPRLDSTQTSIPGSGSQRIADPSTWTFSSNPALCLAWYLYNDTLGLGEASAKIDWDLVADAADICDELVSIPGSTTQKRYTCNLVLEATTPYQDNIDALRQTMMGVCYYAGGKWRMYAGDWQASSHTITQDDIVNEGIEIVTALDYSERYNGVRGTFTSADANYQVTEFPAVSSTNYVTADGEAAWRDMDFVGCTNVYEAQRNAILTLRRSRLNQVLKMRVGPMGWEILPFQVVTVTIPYIGWSSKTARVESWKPNPDGTVELIVREEASSDWDDPLVADYLTPLNVTPPASGTYIPDPATDLAVASVYGGVSLRWTPARTHGQFTRYNVYRNTTSTYSTATKIANNISGSTYVANDATDTTKYYWVTAVDAIDGGESSQIPADGGAAAAATLPTDGGDDTVLIVDDAIVLNVTLSTSSISTTLDTISSANSASVTATAEATNTPVTYAWTRQSGSTSITANSASSATTSFAVSGITNGQTLSAVFRCTVTDSTTPTARTATADVTVTFTRSDTPAAGNVTVTNNVTTISKYGFANNLVSGTVTATATGGTGVFTFSWARTSGDSSITVYSQSDTSTQSVVSFTCNGLTVAGATADAVFTVTASDTASPAGTDTATVDVYFERLDSSGGGGGGPIP